MKEYHTRSRLLRHLAYTKRGCYVLLRGWQIPLTPEEANTLDAEEAKRLQDDKRRGCQLPKHKLPVIMLNGPILPLREIVLGGVEQPVQNQAQEDHKEADIEEANEDRREVEQGEEPLAEEDKKTKWMAFQQAI